MFKSVQHFGSGGRRNIHEANISFL